MWLQVESQDMKFLLTTLLSLSIVTDAFCNDVLETSDFINGCKFCINIMERDTEGLTNEEFNEATESASYISGFIEGRRIAVYKYANLANGGKIIDDDSEIQSYEEELFGYILPKVSPYVIAKLIVKIVESDPRILSYSKDMILALTLDTSYSAAD